ncbi:MAG: hypothetical protein CMM01_03785 [Rhodopirellula sp.]|nr:hypothetical protein [Rhodopirellula sp.]
MASNLWESRREVSSNFDDLASEVLPHDSKGEIQAIASQPNIHPVTGDYKINILRNRTTLASKSKLASKTSLATSYLLIPT